MGLYTPEGVVNALDSHSDESTVDTETKIRELGAQCHATPGSFVWLGLFEPTRAELEIATEVFGLQHLQVEDAANQSQRPKVELDSAGCGMVLLKVLDYTDSTSDVSTGQLAVFVGPWFAVTVRFGQLGDLGGIRRRLEASPGLRSHGPVSVIYAVLDQVVDGYLAVTDEVSIDVQDLETAVFAQDPSASTPNSIYRLKRENVEVRRAVGPLVTSAHAFVSDEIAWIPTELRPYFGDIGDHILRVNDTVESADNLLMTMLMAATSLQDLQQNRDMRKISAWVAIAAVPTAVAGLYGMNFDAMPGLHDTWGYPVVIGLVAVACFALFRGFKRSGWL